MKAECYNNNEKQVTLRRVTSFGIAFKKELNPSPSVFATLGSIRTDRFPGYGLFITKAVCLCNSGNWRHYPRYQIAEHYKGQNKHGS